jgi:hypothetical protein
MIENLSIILSLLQNGVSRIPFLLLVYALCSLMFYCVAKVCRERR